MARPTKRTTSRRATLLRTLREGASYNGAARAAGMSPSLFRQWRSDDASLAAEVEAAQQAAEEEKGRPTRGVETRGETRPKQGT